MCWDGIDLCFKHIYKKEEIFLLMEIECENNIFMGPNNPDSILTSMYGNYLTLPPENDRFSHYKNILIIVEE